MGMQARTRVSCVSECAQRCGTLVTEGRDVTQTRIVIIGGGPAGYEAALVAVQLGAQVTVVERDGLGGACVLYDCVPSKTFIASSDIATAFRGGDALGVMACEPEDVKINAP